MKIEIFYHIILMTLYHHDARMICILIDSLGTEAMSPLWPISDAVEMKKSLKFSESSAASVLVSPFSFKIILPHFQMFFPEWKYLYSD